MRLLLLHGRKDPAEEMDDWGFTGPVIEGIKAVHYTYGAANIFFESYKQAMVAHWVTGWEFWDTDSLQMPVVEGTVFTEEYDSGMCYYGDWEFQSQTPAGESV